MAVFAPSPDTFVPLRLKHSEWLLFSGSNVDENLVPFAAYRPELTSAGGGSAKAQKFVIPADGKFDLNIIYGERAKVGTPAMFVNEIDSPDGRPMQIGVGVDWWFTAYLNGKPLYSTLKTGGNQNAVPEKTDHVFNLPLTPGNNVLVLLTLAGSSTRKHAIGAVPFRDLAPKTAELRNAPYIVNPQNGGCTVRFTSDGPMAGGIALRKSGSNEEFISYWQTECGILRRDSDLHSVTLKNLQPGAEYEFKVLLQYSDTNAIHELPEIYKFIAPGETPKNFSMFISGDTQLMPEHRRTMVSKLFAFPGAAQADYFVHIGDAGSTFNNFEPDYFDGLMDVFNAAAMPNTPIFIPLRGNHEFYGKECVKYVQFFGTGNGETFQAFRQGDTFFLVLDSGPEDSNGPFDSRAYIFTMWDEYWRRHREFIEQTLESEAFKTAKFRVIFSHATPALTPDNWCIREFADGLFTQYRFHLWLGGHVHAYRRSLPDSDRILSNQQPDKTLRSGHDYAYPIITIDGPHATGTELSGTLLKRHSNCLELCSFDLNGQIFDQIRIFADGKVQELGHSLIKF